MGVGVIRARTRLTVSRIVSYELVSRPEQSNDICRIRSAWVKFGRDRQAQIVHRETIAAQQHPAILRCSWMSLGRFPAYPPVPSGDRFLIRAGRFHDSRKISPAYKAAGSSGPVHTALRPGDSFLAFLHNSRGWRRGQAWWTRASTPFAQLDDCGNEIILVRIFTHY